MKLKNIFMLLTLTLGAFTFVACGDDDPDPDPQDQGTISEANKEVVGTYTGWTHLTTKFIDKKYNGDTFTLKLEEDGTLTGIFVNKIWGTATLKGITATKGYKLEHGGGSFVMNDPRDNTTQEFSCWLDFALISADRKQMTAVIIANMDMTGAHGEMTFTFHTGEMPTEE